MLLLSFVLSIIGFSLVNAQISYTCNPNAPCGCSSQPAMISRIFGGESAANNTWNWAVSIMFNQSYYCGGVLISPSWVLTTATCVWMNRASEILISAGTNVFFGLKQSRTASLVIKHPNFDPIWWTNDIALIRVSSPFNMSDPSIGLICLPNVTNGDWPSTNASLITVGWGGTTVEDVHSSSLQQVTLQRLEYNSTNCMILLMNETTQMCVWGMNGTKGVCTDDMGGPLMMFTPSRQWVLVALNSYSYGCFDTGWPSVHTRIIPFLNWIRSMNVTGTVFVGLDGSSMSTTTTTTTPSTTLTNQNRNTTQSSKASHSSNTSEMLALCIITTFFYQAISTCKFNSIFKP